jgi:hypothetical protein
MSSNEEPKEIPRVEYSAEVEEAWLRFCHIYEKSRIVIETRWMGMTRGQREEAMNLKWKESGGSGSPMPEEHRPDLT